jgi:hypothetical protein
LAQVFTGLSSDTYYSMNGNVKERNHGKQRVWAVLLFEGPIELKKKIEPSSQEMH